MIESPVRPAAQGCFTAMGCSIEILLGEGARDTEQALALAEAEFARLEQVFSRFRSESELSRLNRAGQLRVGPELVDVVERALAARAATEGRFDPTVHDALVAAGYDRPFERIEPAARRGPPAAACDGQVIVDHAASTITLAPGVRLDLGGIAKGWAVDRVCALLEPFGDCLVNAGGDLAVRGLHESGPWPVAAETAEGSLTLGLIGGALATSGRDVRRWETDRGEAHHLIDPGSGRPAAVDLVRATALGVDAVEAEIRAKDLFLLGAERAAERADRLAIPALLVTEDGRTILAGGLA